MPSPLYQRERNMTCRCATMARTSLIQQKEGAEAAAGEDKDTDPDYVKSEEGSSQDPLYEPSKKELKRADKEGDKYNK